MLDPGRGKTKTGYLWAIARDDRPWGSSEPPAVVYAYAPGRGGVHAVAHDPEAKGFGIYGVLWFGDKRPSPISKHPDGLEPPKSAAELEQMPRDHIPAERRNRLAVLVTDVSGPPATKQGRSPASTKRNKKGTVAKKAYYAEERGSPEGREETLFKEGDCQATPQQPGRK